MKPFLLRRVLPIAVLVLFGVINLVGQNLLRNGSFETANGNEPSGWTTSNIPKMLTNVTTSTKCHGGTLAVKCEVKDFFGTKMAGMITQKNVEVRGQTLELSGYYVLSAVGNDAGFVSVELQTPDGNTVKIFHKNLTKPVAEFTSFKLVCSVPAGADHLELRLSLLAGQGSERVHEGSSILFDDLRMVPVATPEEDTSR